MTNILKEIEYTVTYNFKENVQKYFCEVEISLPCNDKGELLWRFQNEKVQLNGEKLGKEWGYKTEGENTRSRYKTLTNKNFQILQELEKEHLKNAASIIEKVSKDNELANINLPNYKSGKLSEYM